MSSVSGNDSSGDGSIRNSFNTLTRALEYAGYNLASKELEKVGLGRKKKRVRGKNFLVLLRGI